MRLSPEAERDHQHLIQHVVQVGTEAFRQERIDELDDTGLNPYDEHGIVHCILCKAPTIVNPCRRCAAILPESGTLNGVTP